MNCEPLDVVVVPFPFADRLSSKRRPALVVSSGEFNGFHEQTILAMITSAHTDWRSDVAIRRWREAGLNVPCKVRLKLFTLDNTLILRKAGRLANRDGEAVGKALFRYLVTDRSSEPSTRLR